MDAQHFMNGLVNYCTLSTYLGSNFNGTYQSRDQGRRLLEMYGVVPGMETSKRCPDCGKSLEILIDKRSPGDFLYKCLNHGEQCTFKPYLNTFLANSLTIHDLPEDRVVFIVFCWLKKMPVKELINEYNFSSENTIYWYNFCRDVASAITWHEYMPIGGPHDIVEVDRLHVFKKELQQDSLAECKYLCVVGGISRTTKQRFVFAINQKNENTLLEVLGEYICYDSYICSDSWNGYNGCETIFSGHGRVNRSTKNKLPFWAPPGRFNMECLVKKSQQKPPTPGMQHFRNHIRNIKKCWGDLKVLMKIRTVASANQYLGEYMYRKNILEPTGSTGKQFSRFLHDIARVHPGIGKNAMKVTREEIMNGCGCHECI